jgi:hypothetical protein
MRQATLITSPSLLGLYSVMRGQVITTIGRASVDGS